MEIQLRNGTYNLDVTNILVEGSFGPLYVLEGPAGAQKKVCKVYKLNANDTTQLKHFVSHLKALSKLKHPSICEIDVIASVEKSLFTCMDYFNYNLEDFIQSKRPKLPVLFELTVNCVHGLLYLHTQLSPIIHGQLKPSNIFVIKRQEGYHACLSDPGLRDAFQHRSEDSSKDHYDSNWCCTPERILHGWGVETGDVFALGVIVLAIISWSPVRQKLSSFCESNGLDIGHQKALVLSEDKEDFCVTASNGLETGAIQKLKGLINEMTRAKPELRIQLSDVDIKLAKIIADSLTKKANKTKTSSKGKKITKDLSSKEPEKRSAPKVSTPMRSTEQANSANSLTQHENDSMHCLYYEVKIGDTVFIDGRPNYFTRAQEDEYQKCREDQCFFKRGIVKDRCSGAKDHYNIIFPKGNQRQCNLALLLKYDLAFPTESIRQKKQEKDSSFLRHDVVHISSTMEEFQQLMGDKWISDMSTVLNVRGVVVKVENNTAFVQFANHKKFQITCDVLEKINTQEECMGNGDLVVVTNSRQEAIRHQDNCGGWIGDMEVCLGKAGIVMEVFLSTSASKVRVQDKKSSKIFIWNMNCLKIIAKKDDVVTE